MLYYAYEKYLEEVLRGVQELVREMRREGTLPKEAITWLSTGGRGHVGREEHSKGNSPQQEVTRQHAVL